MRDDGVNEEGLDLVREMHQTMMDKMHQTKDAESKEAT